MAEVQPRPSASRGRGSGRAGRGGFSSRGGARSSGRQANGDASQPTPEISLEEQGELGQLKMQYMTEVTTLKEMFPDWTDDDLVFALQETDGDLQTTIERITEGAVSRFADVKKKTREKSRVKAPDAQAITEKPTTTSTRGRSRGGLESSRGGRGRGSDRGRGASRGGRGSSTNGSRSVTAPVASVPTTETSGWGDATTVTTAAGIWEPTASADGTAAPAPAAAEQPAATAASASEQPKSSIIPEGGAKKSWASMLAPPKPVPAMPKAPSSQAPAGATDETHPVPEAVIDETDNRDITPTIQNAEIATPIDSSEIASTADVTTRLSSDTATILTPPKDKLTEDNLDNLPDTSVAPSTETVASTRDARSTVGSVTPSYGSLQQPQQQPQPISRPPMGGYATTAWKHAGTPGRTSSFQRRMMEQQEAVVMPGNHAVDRATVQFGSMGLGDSDGKPVDVDDDREEAETRAQPPQQSPSQPRASLPPAPQHQSAPIDQAPESLAAPKQAPGLPPPSAQQQPGGSHQAPPGPLGPPGIGQPAPQSSQQYGQYGRYSAGTLGQDQTAPSQKPYDPFSQQLNYGQSQNDQSMYPGHSQTASTSAQQAPSHHGGATSQAPSEYGSQYATEHQRNAYQNYYGGSYGQQQGMGGLLDQSQTQAPQRSSSGLGGSESAYGSAPLNQAQSRLGESSGHTTPNPTLSAQQQMGQPSQQQAQHMHQQPQGQGQQGSGYYGNPYYGGSYYGNYMSQYPQQQYGYNQQGFGGPFGGKGGMYGQPHHGYGMSPQNSYEHSSSPANAGGFGASSASVGRESSFTGGLNEYSRAGSTQPSQAPQNPSAGVYGGMEGIGRSPSGFGGHAGSYGQPATSGADDSMKSFNESKAGPSPSLGQPNRTGSAINSTSHQQSGQSGFAPPQSQGYGNHHPGGLNQLHAHYGSQYGGLGGLGGHQQGASGHSHQGGGYSGYGSFGGAGGSNYGNYGRGGWGGNYGH